MTTRLILGAIIVSLFTWVISVLVGRWADREASRAAEERQRLERIMRANEPPMAPGLKASRQRVS